MGNKTITTDTSIQERDLGGGAAGRTIGGLSNLEVVEAPASTGPVAAYDNAGATEEIVAPSSLVKQAAPVAETNFASTTTTATEAKPATGMATTTVPTASSPPSAANSAAVPWKISWRKPKTWKPWACAN